MAGSGIEMGAAVLMVLGIIMNIVCVAMPIWKRNDPQDTVLDSIFRHEGLWIKCQTFATGNWDCDDFDRFFIGLPANLQGARALGVICLMLGIGGIVTIFLGMTCMPCGGDDARGKRRMRMISGILALLSGFAITVACGWYANDIRISHDRATAMLLQSQGGVTRYIFGEALFIGWAGGALALIGGILAMVTGCGDDDEDNSRGYVYRPPKQNHRNSQEYV